MSDNTAVEYRSIPGFFAYEVGSDGTVWSRRTRRRDKRSITRRPRKRRLSRNGYWVVTLMDGEFSKTCYVHTLVLLAFCGPPPEGMECCHGPGGPLDNSVSNLRWDTHQANLKDREAAGTIPRGERHYAAKFTDDDIRNIRDAYANGERVGEIAKRIGALPQCISKIVQRKRWVHVT